jgi:superfamily II DNA helicase RecQ
MVCIDEVHSTVQNFELFRPELKTAMDSIDAIITIARKRNKNTIFHVPILAMSAIFTMDDQQSFNQLIRRQSTMVFWGDIVRRNIAFNVYIAGNPLHALVNDWTKIAAQQPTWQSLIYSHSAAACDGVIMKQLITARSCVPVNTGAFFI